MINFTIGILVVLKMYRLQYGYGSKIQMIKLQLGGNQTITKVCNIVVVI